MTAALGQIATVRSKNAGPFWLTIDVFAADAAGYEAIAASPVADPAAVAAIYDLDPDAVRIFRLPRLHAIKVSFPRPQVQGSLRDRDMHAGQQYVPLLSIPVEA